MPCWKNNNMVETVGHRQRSKLVAIVLFLGGLLGMFFQPAWAQSSVQLTDQLLERGDDGVYLSATLDFALSPSLEDALSRGMPLTFVMQAEVMRERWYWYDKKVSGVDRYFRLTYQPLSRRWRLHVSSAPIQSIGLGVTLGNSYDSLADAMAVVQKINRWKVADTQVLQKDVKQRLDLRFRLDLSQLPQALQFGNQASSDWNVNFDQSFRLEELAK
ncbi:MAG: DUF4390 domain-containing protein [Betaproteobacteria bacterium]|nr:DUF4390 domain-containing protein [Betaproteobacteria bacterium]